MGITQISTLEWFPSIEEAISSGAIRTFGTAEHAREEAHKWGWGRSIIRVNRRFERIYIIGVVDFQGSLVCGIPHQTMRIPLLRYETNDSGVEYQPVVVFSRPEKFAKEARP